MATVNLFWFRRDLRIEDNAGLYHALRSDLPVIPIFIFDTEILGRLENIYDARITFIHSALKQIQSELTAIGSTLEVYHGRPKEVFQRLILEKEIGKVYTNHDYEPYARARDAEIGDLLNSMGVDLIFFKDQVIFEKDEVIKEDGSPYGVFTPYSRKWKARLNDFYLSSYPASKYKFHFFKQSARDLPTIKELGFEPAEMDFPSSSIEEERIKKYNGVRDFPAIPGTSRLGVHLRFGTMSIRKLVRSARALSETFLNELIWREFYQMILFHHPEIGKGMPFKKEYDNIRYRNNEEEFLRWCEGSTGYPIVDAGMRELNETGFMHNRVRMITASFLCKHLLIDWRWGEAYFAEKLLDFDFASNNGGWQWVAGSGCDAAPYFRVFNPTLQTKKFDPQLEYIRRWVPEFESFEYPAPLVEHEFARRRCLSAYKEGLVLGRG